MKKKYLGTETKINNLLQGILWSKDIKNLDLEKDKIYVIHQILSYGSLKQIKWLFKNYNLKEVQGVFIKYPKKTYTPSVFYFIKNFILGLQKKRLSEEKYVKTSL